MVAQDGAPVLGAVDTSALEFRHQLVNDVGDRGREQVRHDVESVDGAGGDVAGPLVGHGRRRAGERRVARCHLQHQLPYRQAPFGRQLAPLADQGRFAGAVRDGDRAA